MGEEKKLSYYQKNKKHYQRGGKYYKYAKDSCCQKRGTRDMAQMTGGEAIGGTLKALGVEFVFGLTVTTQVPLTMSLIRSGIRMMTVRTEMCSSLMATAYSKISGMPGVCLVSGAGSAHAALGMHEAYLSSNAMVVITSIYIFHIRRI